MGGKMEQRRVPLAAGDRDLGGMCLKKACQFRGIACDCRRDGLAIDALPVDMALSRRQLANPCSLAMSSWPDAA